MVSPQIAAFVIRESSPTAHVLTLNVLRLAGAIDLSSVEARQTEFKMFVYTKIVVHAIFRGTN